MGRRPMLTNPLWEHIRDRQQSFSTALLTGETLSTCAGGEARSAGALDERRVLQDARRASARWTCADAGRRPARLCGAARGDQLRLLAARIRRRPECHRPYHDAGRPPLSTIVGVTPANFFGMEVGRDVRCRRAALRRAAFRGARTLSTSADGWFLAGFGRLKPETTIEQAGAHLAGVSAHFQGDAVAALHRR